MSSSLRKLKKVGDATPTDLETSVAQAIFDLEVNSKALKLQLYRLHFVAAKEVKINKTRKAIIIFVPLKQIHYYQRIHVTLVSELEKKFSGSHVVIVADRKAERTPSNPSKVKRSRNKTLVKRNEYLMDDVCYPNTISGKRTRVRVDGSRFTRVHLDDKEKTNYDHKAHTFSVVYRVLTGQKVKYQWEA